MPRVRRSEQGLSVEWGGLLRRMRTQETGEKAAQPPAATPPEEPATPATPPVERNTWASGALLAAAARLVARGEENTYTLRRVVEWATAATGARRAVLWAVERDENNQPQLALLAWAAADGWRPSELPGLHVHTSPALMRAFRTSEAVIVAHDRPQERGAEWDTRLGITPIALCAAISAGETRGILAVAGLNAEGAENATFSEDARTALVACAALAAIVFDRQRDGLPSALPAPSDATPLQATLAPADKSAASPTTPLPDSAAMTRRLDEEIGRARRFDHPLAVLLITIDRVEEWVERLGTAKFAALRTYLIDIVRESIREVDLLGRGEDEALIVILPVSGVDDALRVGERIRAMLDRRQPDLAEEARLRLTISGGAVSYPDDGSSGAELLGAAAHTAAYAQRMGRDQIRLRGLGDMESPPQLDEASIPTALRLRSVQQVGQAFQALLDSLTMASDAHDQARPGHSYAVGRYARALAEACGLNPDQARTIELAGALHDVGKIGMPVDIIGKRGKLTVEERAVLREQPTVGKLLLLQIPALEAIIPLVEHAHERYDGAGYPAGLRGNQIPFGSRLIAIAEGYEAMINERPYRRALSQSMAIAELWREAGSRYDPQLVDTFVQLLKLLNDAAGEPTALAPITIATSEPERFGEGATEPVPTAEPSGHGVVAEATGGQDVVPSEPTVVQPPADASDEPAAILQTPSQQPAQPEPDTLIAKVSAPTADLPAAQPTEPLVASAPSETSAEPSGARSTASVRRADPNQLATVTGEVVEWPIQTANPQEPQQKAPQGATATEHVAGEAGIEWYDDDVARPTGETDQPGRERLDQLNVEDTILMMSQTTLLRLAELGRLTKRRTGFLTSDPKREGKE